MKGYIAFIKKEFVENLKNYRFFILFTIFAIFGLSSAFLAKFTPEIIEAPPRNLSPLTHGSSFIKIFLGSDSAH